MDSLDSPFGATPADLFEENMIGQSPSTYFFKHKEEARTGIHSNRKRVNSILLDIRLIQQNGKTSAQEKRIRKMHLVDISHWQIHGEWR